MGDNWQNLIKISILLEHSENALFLTWKFQLSDKGANFRNLLSILKIFYKEMGFEKVRFRPAYFPYTEMSVEPEIYFEEKGEWMELGGAGIFRPEVTVPLMGFECPVLAWGLGLDRVVALKLGLNDIRDLYISDLKWLRESKV